MTDKQAVADIKECLENNMWGCGRYTEALVKGMSALSESAKGEYIKKDEAIKAFEKSLLGKYIFWDKQEEIKKDMRERISQLHAYSIPDSTNIEKIRSEIQTLRGCSCNCSDGIIDDVEDIIDKCVGGE